MTEINEMVKLLLETLKSTKDFVGDQAPKVVNEIVKYELYNSLFNILIALLVLFGVYKVVKYNTREKITEEGPFIIACILCPAISFICFVTLINNINMVIKCEFAPRLVVLSYLQHILH